MWFIYNLHVLILLVPRSLYLLSAFDLFLGSLVRLTLVFALILPWLIIWSCIGRDLFRLSLDRCSLILLFFFFNCYFSDRLGLFLVGHFNFILATRVCRLLWVLLLSSRCAWTWFFHLVHLLLGLLLSLTWFDLLRFRREISILHDSIPTCLLTIFLHLLLLFHLIFCHFKLRLP
jgi:hypothetical protein